MCKETFRNQKIQYLYRKSFDVDTYSSSSRGLNSDRNFILSFKSNLNFFRIDLDEFRSTKASIFVGESQIVESRI